MYSGAGCVRSVAFCKVLRQPPNRRVLHPSAGDSQPGHPNRPALEHPAWSSHAVAATSVADDEKVGARAWPTADALRSMWQRVHEAAASRESNTHGRETQSQRGSITAPSTRRPRPGRGRLGGDCSSERRSPARGRRGVSRFEGDRLGLVYDSLCGGLGGRRGGDRLMSGPFHDGSRRLQDRFDTRRLADRLDEKFIQDPLITADDRAFIERMDMFFLATADRERSAAVLAIREASRGSYECSTSTRWRSRTTTAPGCISRWATFR